MPSISSNKKSSTPPVPSPSNPVLLATQSQWLFTDSELLRSPSVLDGMPIESEHTSRGKGVNFIMQVGILLKLPQLTLCTASVYLHRFFMRYSMVDLPQRPGMHPYSIAATALFLATKVEENCRKMRELIIACCRVALKQPNVVVDEQSKEFWKWRDTILHNEDLLLEALCFDLQLEQPYRLLYDFLCYLHQHDNKPLRNSAWAFINDSIFTVLCLQFTSRTIAASALYAAARHCDVSFDDDILGRPWWEQLDVELRDLKRACNRMAELYERSPLPKPGQRYPSIPGNEGDSTDKTRHVISRGNENGTEDGYTDERNGSLSPGEISERKRSREADNLPSPKQNPLQHTHSVSTNGRLNQEQEQRSLKRQRLDDNQTTAPNFRSPLTHSQTQSQFDSQPKSNQSSQPSLTNATSTLHISSNNNSTSPETATPTSTTNPPQPETTNLNGNSNPEHRAPPPTSLSAPTTPNDKPQSSRIPASYQRKKEAASPRPPGNIPPKPPLD
ncbi:hypothetical protein DIZ76_010681 [Coccidioides immitis]|nr:hypothetical protein DIZ76_010681 [Coccidioides immitis]